MIKIRFTLSLIIKLRGIYIIKVRGRAMVKGSAKVRFWFSCRG